MFSTLGLYPRPVSWIVKMETTYTKFCGLSTTYHNFTTGRVRIWFVCLFVCFSVCLFVFLYVCFSVHLFVYLFVTTS